MSDDQMVSCQNYYFQKISTCGGATPGGILNNSIDCEITLHSVYLLQTHTLDRHIPVFKLTNVVVTTNYQDF